MRMVVRTGWRWLASCLLLACLCAGADAMAANSLNIVPTPKSLDVTGGEMPLGPQGRIVFADPRLKPLAEILSREIMAVTTMKLQAVEGEARPGDIVLKLNPQLRADADIWTVQKRELKKVRDYAHTIHVTDRAVIEGWDYRACCEGTATLLQAMKETGGAWALPKMRVKDWPYADFCGFMIDCARQEIPLLAVKNAVDAARFWKIRYIHLHMNDFNAFVFPVKSYKFPSQFGAINNGDGPKTWDLEELNKAVAYADARGVTLVPELEMPYHADALGGGIPQIFKGRLIDILGDDTYPVLDKIIGEMCAVFKSSEYFHIGGDEVEFHWYGDQPHVKAWLKEHGVSADKTNQRNKDAMLTYFVQRTNAIVKKYGKKTVFWSGHQSPPHVKELNDCIAYCWFNGAGDAQKVGMPLITVPWEIGVPFPEWNIFQCNKFALDRSHPVLGHSKVLWEMSAESLMRQIRGGVLQHNVSERQERAWGPDTKIDLEEYKARMAKADARLGRLLFPVTVTEDVKLDGRGGEKCYFSQPMTWKLAANLPAGCCIRYTLDGSEPTADSPAYEKPLQITRHLRTRAAIFDEAGQRIGGITLGMQWEHRDFEQNLTTGKPVEASGDKNPNEKAEYAVDGWVDNQKFWGTIPAPQWLQVDLQKEVLIDRVHIFPYWDGHRAYQYTISVGADPKNLTRVVDESKNTTTETSLGRSHKFAPTKARYIRVDMLRNSSNPAVHLVEVRAYEAGK